MAKQREHFERRITNIIEAEIGELLGKSSDLSPLTMQEAQERLGIAELCQQMDRLEVEYRAICDDLRRTRQEINAIVLRRFPDLENSEQPVEDARERLAKERSDEACAKTPEGKAILGLRTKLEELLDMLYLATTADEYTTIMAEAQSAVKSAQEEV